MKFAGVFVHIMLNMETKLNLTTALSKKADLVSIFTNEKNEKNDSGSELWTIYSCGVLKLQTSQH